MIPFLYSILSPLLYLSFFEGQLIVTLLIWQIVICKKSAVFLKVIKIRPSKNMGSRIFLKTLSCHISEPVTKEFIIFPGRLSRRFQVQDPLVFRSPPFQRDIPNAFVVLSIYQHVDILKKRHIFNFFISISGP